MLCYNVVIYIYYYYHHYYNYYYYQSILQLKSKQDGVAEDSKTLEDFWFQICVCHYVRQLRLEVSEDTFNSVNTKLI